MKKLSILAACLAIFGCNQTDSTSVKSNKNAIWPVIQSQVVKAESIENKVKALLDTMTLEQKIAQMIQPEIRDISIEDMRKYGFGSYLNGGGAFPSGNKYSTPQEWVDYAQLMYEASIDDALDGSKIPTMWGTDAVHGHNNVIGATLFPHNIGLGAANNPALIKDIATATATEVMATGIDWVFAPTVAAVRDDRWGRTYEGYSEDPEIIKAYASAIVEGLQGKPGVDFMDDSHVISTVKHFIGDGGTKDGIDQGNNMVGEQELFDIHAQGYVGGLTAGAQSVMASFNRWQGAKIHGSKYLINDVLKEKMGFDGFVVGDWNGHGQVRGCSNESCPAAINAGLDIFMAPTHTWKALYENTIKQVQEGDISLSRIDDAVSRILRVKFRAGLFDKPSPANRKYAGKTEYIGHEKHRKIAEKAVRESLVLLKNNDSTLPISANQRILVVGDGADNIGKQSGGWSISWQGTNNTNDDFPGGTSIYDGIDVVVKKAGGSIVLSVDGKYEEKPDVVIAVYGEEPYAEGQGDVKTLAYNLLNTKELKMLQGFKQQGIPVVSVFISGRPMWVNPYLNASDAFVAAWLPGSEGKAVADVLFKRSPQNDFKGRLSFSWPATPDQIVNRHDKDYSPLFPYGYGLTYEDDIQVKQLSERHTLVIDGQQAEALFDGKLVAPWILSLMDEMRQTPVNSSSVELGGLSYRTIDKIVQEDAFKLSHQGNTLAGLWFNNKDDGYGVSGDNRMVELTVRREALLPESVMLALNCDDIKQCQHAVALANQVNALPVNTWGSVRYSLSCFNQLVASHSKLKSLGVISSSKMSLDISAIRMTIKEPASTECN